MNNKSKLKIMATSLALSAVSSGAWGLQLKPELDSGSGCYIWRALKSEVSPGIFFPAEAPYITGKTPVFSIEDSPLFLLRFDPSIRRDENDTDVRKMRGIYNPAKIREVFRDNLTLDGKNIIVHVVMQPFPQDVSGGLYIRPDLACLPSKNKAPSTAQTLSFGVTKIMADGVATGEQNIVIAGQNNQGIVFEENSLGKPIEALKLDGVAIPGNCKHFSFWSYVESDNIVFITYHWLINRGDVQKLRGIHRLAFFAKEYGSSAYDAWSGLYSSDMMWRANYEAVCKSLGKEPVASTASADAKKAAYEEMVKDPAVKGFVSELATPGHVGILRFMWRLKDNFSYGNEKSNLFYKHSHEPGFAFLYR